MNPKNIYRYYRVPEGREVPKKGRPQPQDVAQYVKGEATFKPQSNGGIVECIFSVNDHVVIGTAHCSFSDNFSYRVGRSLAGKRAMEKALKFMTPQQKEGVGLILLQSILQGVMEAIG